MRPRRLLRTGRFRRRVRLAPLHCQARVLGPGRGLQRSEAGLDERPGGMSKRGRRVHRVHDARISRQVHAVHGGTAGRSDVDIRRLDVRTRRSCAAQFRQAVAGKGAESIQQQPGWSRAGARQRSGVMATSGSTEQQSYEQLLASLESLVPENAEAMLVSLAGALFPSGAGTIEQLSWEGADRAPGPPGNAAPED